MTNTNAKAVEAITMPELVYTLRAWDRDGRELYIGQISPFRYMGEEDWAYHASEETLSNLIMYRSTRRMAVAIDPDTEKPIGRRMIAYFTTHHHGHTERHYTSYGVGYFGWDVPRASAPVPPAPEGENFIRENGGGVVGSQLMWGHVVRALSNTVAAMAARGEGVKIAKALRATGVTPPEGVSWEQYVNSCLFFWADEARVETVEWHPCAARMDFHGREMLVVSPGALKTAFMVLPHSREVVSITDFFEGRYELQYGFYGPQPGTVREDVMKALKAPAALSGKDRAAARWFSKLASASAEALLDDLRANTAWESFQVRKPTDSVADMSAICGITTMCEEYPEWQGTSNLDEDGQEIFCLRYIGDFDTRERMNRVWPEPCGLPWKMIRLYQE